MLELSSLLGQYPSIEKICTNLGTRRSRSTAGLSDKRQVFTLERLKATWRSCLRSTAHYPRWLPGTIVAIRWPVADAMVASEQGRLSPLKRWSSRPYLPPFCGRDWSRLSSRIGRRHQAEESFRLVVTGRHGWRMSLAVSVRLQVYIVRT